MKKILITGANSYIGTSFEKWVAQFPNKYSVDKISVRDEHWKESSFEGYDAIFHTAAIVHVKENDTRKYFEINRDLTVKIAKKAKQEGVKHFIFLSTMGVYGIETGYVTEDTTPAPKTLYAQSKYQAEQLLTNMVTNDFNVAILRPPIVYGQNCPGNYTRLANMARNLPVFPDVKNERSMIYIDNLSEFVRIIINHGVGGIYFPQNKEYVNTAYLVNLIAETHGKEIKLSKILNGAVMIGLKVAQTFRKVFGSFVYVQGLPGGPGTIINGERIDYETVSFAKSIFYTEGNGEM